MYGWEELSVWIAPGDEVRVIHPSDVSCDHCGSVLVYNVSTSEAQVELEEEVNGVRFGTIPRQMITKISGSMTGLIPMCG